jgi:hypothetical protein
VDHDNDILYLSPCSYYKPVSLHHIWPLEFDSYHMPGQLAGPFCVPAPGLLWQRGRILRGKNLVGEVDLTPHRRGDYMVLKRTSDLVSVDKDWAGMGED